MTVRLRQTNESESGVATWSCSNNATPLSKDRCFSSQKLRSTQDPSMQHVTS